MIESPSSSQCLTPHSSNQSSPSLEPLKTANPPTLTSAKPGEAEQGLPSAPTILNCFRTARELTIATLSLKENPSFKQGLCEKLNDETALFTYLHSGKLKGDIVIWQGRETKYSIQEAHDTLDHPGTVEHDDETGYIQIEWTPTSKRPPTKTQQLNARRRFRADLPKQISASEADGDFFLPLGWLVEGNGSGAQRLTRYVCMLNISTSPLSIWLVYDYVTTDDDENTVELRDLSFIYDDRYHGGNIGLPPLTGAKRLVGSSDLLLVHEDLANWDPKGGDIKRNANGKLPDGFSYHLGPSTRAVGVVPPKSLLDDITVASEE